jgi:hypothetical protein
MSDIVERIRSLRYVHVPVASGLMAEAAAEIERLRTLATHATQSGGSVLRNGSAESRETVCPHVRGTVTQHCSLNFTITDEEREAIEIAAAELDDEYYGTNCKKELAAAVTLRKLLERLR